MVMKVGNVNPILFKASVNVSKPEEKKNDNVQIKELANVTPDFAVKIPQKYTSLGVKEVFNGLKIHSYKLANGHKVSIIPMEGSPATVKNYVNVGSMNETDDIKGISHFLEHMAFNGTYGDNGYIKLDTGDSFKKLDELGGNINASTGYAVTDYINTSPMLEDADLEKQIEICAAMTENLKLSPEMIEKEKGPVCSEINMILDNPQTIALDQTARTLFNIKSSSDELIAGSVKHIKNLTREQVKAYYDKYYTPDNMNLVITGDVNPDETIELVAKHFKSTKQRQGNVYQEKLVPINKTVRKDFVSDKATSAQIIMGFSGAKSNDVKSSVLFEVANMYLASSNVGLLEKLKEYNSGFWLDSEKISANPKDPQFMIIGATASEENAELVLKTLYEELSDVQKPTEKQLDSIKVALLREFNNTLEYSTYVNHAVGQTVLTDSVDYLAKYDEILKSITPEDVEEFIKTYINMDKAAITVVHPPITNEKMFENYNKANLSFKGKAREPMNMGKISTQTLDNNFYLGFLDSKNDNVNFKINLKYDLPKDLNQATVAVFNQMLAMGTKNKTREEVNRFSEENNVSVYTSVTNTKFSSVGETGVDKFDTAYELMMEKLATPRLDEETFNKAVAKVKDNLSRSKDTSNSVYKEYEANNSHLRTSRSQILNGLESLTLDDVKALHNHILSNSQGMIIMNIPEKHKDLKEKAIEKYAQLPTVKVNDNNLHKIYKPNSEPIVLTKERAVSQADIMQTYKYKLERTAEEQVKEELINIMMNSSSIGLFNTLREKEQLAYSVHSRLNSHGDCGEVSFNILTTTDNKEIGETPYDNLQKSINGFNRQLNCLLNSEYTDEDLENAKRILKAGYLSNEGVVSKLAVLNSSMNSLVGIDAQNKCYNLVDSITRDDIDKFAKKMFANPPIYSIVASKDTLNENAQYLEGLKHI